MRPFASNRPSWNLSPDDLPPRELIEREPLLADLENNAVFRLLVWTSKRKADRGNTSRNWALIAGNLLMLSANIDSIIRPVAISPGLGLLLAASGLTLMIWSVAGMYGGTKASGLISIDRAKLRDLISAGTPYVDYVLGVWGFAAVRRFRGRTFAVMILICAALCLFSGLIVSPALMPLLLCLPPTVVTMFTMAGASYWGDRRGIEAGMRMLGLGIGEITNPLRTLGLLACGLIPFVLVIVFWAELSSRLLAQPWLFSAMMLASIPVGILAGYGITLFAPAEPPFHLAVLSLKVGEILAEVMREEV